jgi:hypothetical protein
MAPRYSDPELTKEILSYQFAKVGHCGQGISLVMPNLDYLNLWELRRFLVFFKNRSEPARRSVPLKKVKIKLDFILVLLP